MTNTTWSTTDKEAGVTLSGSNLTATVGGGGFGWVRAAHSLTSGKYYWEVTQTYNHDGTSVGVSTPSASLGGGLSPTGTTCVTRFLGRIQVNGSNAGVDLGGFSGSQLICIALDLDNAKIWYRLGSAGNWNASGTANPATGTGGISVPVLTPASPASFLRPASETATAKFGDSAFTGAVPSGFTAGFPTVAVTPTTGRAKVWTGSAWVVKPAKVWSGSAWVTKPVKVWNGSAWV